MGCRSLVGRVPRARAGTRGQRGNKGKKRKMYLLPLTPPLPRKIWNRGNKRWEASDGPKIKSVRPTTKPFHHTPQEGRPREIPPSLHNIYYGQSILSKHACQMGYFRSLPGTVCIDPPFIHTLVPRVPRRR